LGFLGSTLKENQAMKQTAAVIVLLTILTGCSRQAGVKNEITSADLYDLAIENLSMTAEQLEAIQREKDFFVKSLEDFEQQKAEYGYLLDSGQLRSQMQDFTEWHRDIERRERNLEVQHALNVLAAHNQVAKRRAADPDKIATLKP
jgi:hypothetical protein